jgi:hypothetical protein
MRERSACRCELQRDGVVGELNLLQLSVMSAPVIGGSLGLDVSSLYPDDHRLEVLAVEDVLRPSSSVPASSLSSESSERFRASAQCMASDSESTARRLST